MTDVAGIEFSVTIPAFNEEKYLPRLLESLNAARERYRGGADAIEIIVADNCSTDRTAEVAAAHGARVVRVEKRCIAAARNGGGRAARGAILCFVDADMQAHPETFNAIRDAIDRGRCVAGATGVSMERWSAGIALAYLMIIPMVWLMRMDTGVVFCRREDYEAVGGYNEGRQYAEDVEFLLALRKLGRPRGQGLVRVRGAKAIASTRKFDRFGDWHYLGMAVVFPMLHFLAPKTMARMAHTYWYDERSK